MGKQAQIMLAAISITVQIEIGINESMVPFSKVYGVWLARRRNEGCFLTTKIVKIHLYGNPNTHSTRHADTINMVRWAQRIL